MRIVVVLLLLAVLFATPVGTDRARAQAGISAGAEQSEQEEELDEFVPSEEISADRAISFPVDI